MNDLTNIRRFVLRINELLKNTDLKEDVIYYLAKEDYCENKQYYEKILLDVLESYFSFEDSDYRYEYQESIRMFFTGYIMGESKIVKMSYPIPKITPELHK